MSEQNKDSGQNKDIEQTVPGDKKSAEAKRRRSVPAKKAAAKESPPQTGSASSDAPPAGPPPGTAPPPADTATARSGGGRLLAVLALLLAGGGILSAYLLWQDNQGHVSKLRAQDSRLEQRLDSVEGRTAAIQPQLQQLASANEEIEPSLTALRQTLDQNVDQKLAALKEENKDQISQEFTILQNAVNTIQAKLEEKKPEARKPLWEPAEAEYLIRIANDSLSLRGDVVTALAALRAADQRLQVVGHPALATTRRLLAEEINALLAVPQADIVAAATTLGTLQQQVTALPLKGQQDSAERQSESSPEEERPQAEEEQTGWRAFVSDIWQALKELVTIRRRDVNDEPLMAPEQRLYIGQNLQLKLETARLALLRGDEAAYHGALKTAAQWLESYYVSDDAGVREVLATLARLDKIVVKPDLPSLKASMEAIHEVLESRAYLSSRQPPLGLAANNPAQDRLPAAAPPAKGGEQP